VEKLHNEELRGFYSSSSIIRMIDVRRMICAGHVMQMGEKVTGKEASRKETTMMTKT
jgi:hypothetical protein